MLSHEAEEILAERFVDRIESANTFILEKIGNDIRKISKLNASDAYRLEQLMKYGGDYTEIVKKLSQVSGKSIEEIYKIFEETAKQDQQFAKKFYDYRDVEFIPYSENIALQNQVNALATITASNFMNISKTSTIGYIFEDLEGNKTFKNIFQTYNDVIDEAVLNVSQGTTDFHSAMRRTLKQLGGSGLVVYESGHTRRLDSAVRQNILGGIRDMSTEINMKFGEEYGADGVEITVHSNPAPDHAEIQGRQFTLEQYNKLQGTGNATDVKGHSYTLWHGKGFRPIQEYNCYHRPMNIVVGVSSPQYTDEQLEQINRDNEKGFDYEGKHYSNYEGTQLQRKIETAIRSQKDTQILARASGDNELAIECQNKIKQLNAKYKEVCDASGLLPKKNRLSVSGYNKISITKPKISSPSPSPSSNPKLENFRKLKGQELDSFLGDVIYGTNRQKLRDEGLNDSSDYQKLVYNLGMNDKPKVLSKKEFEESSKGQTLIYRGVKPIEEWDGGHYSVKLSEEDINNNLKYSDKTYIGNGTFMDGIYFTDSKDLAFQYARENEKGISTAYIDKKKARIIDFEKLTEMAREDSKKFPELLHTRMFNDFAVYATHKGYNVIVMDMTELHNCKYYNVLDRSVLVIKE